MCPPAGDTAAPTPRIGAVDCYAPRPVNRRARTVLWIDAGAACVAGIGMLASHEWLAALHAFPLALVGFIGSCNLAYASYSGTLAALATRGTPPSRRAIDLLVAANLTWTAACVAIVVTTRQTASTFGLTHVALEGVFVGGLAVVERLVVRPFAR